MKRMIKASENKYHSARYAQRYLRALQEVGVPEHDILDHFYDLLPLETFVKTLEQIAKLCDCTDEVNEVIADYTVNGD